MPRIGIKRVYEPPTEADGFRVLVDRLWPRGVSKDEAAVDRWVKELAPSTELRRWFGHHVDRWEEFQARYLAELAASGPALRDLLDECGNRPMTLIFAARDTERNHAVVLREVLARR